MGDAVLRGLIYGLTILHLGPGIAFAVVAFGRDASFAALQNICQKDAFAAFIQLTLLVWGMLITGLLLKIYITKYFNKNN